MFGSLIFIKLLHPFVTKLIGKLLSKIPFKIQHIVIDTLLFVMILDTALSSVKYLKLF